MKEAISTRYSPSASLRFSSIVIVIHVGKVVIIIVIRVVDDRLIDVELEMIGGFGLTLFAPQQRLGVLDDEAEGEDGNRDGEEVEEGVGIDRPPNRREFKGLEDAGRGEHGNRGEAEAKVSVA